MTSAVGNTTEYSMWVKYRGHLFNFSHVCGVSVGGPVKQPGGQPDKWYVRIYSSGKCFEVFVFENIEDRDKCFSELEQIVLRLNKGIQLDFGDILNGETE